MVRSAGKGMTILVENMKAARTDLFGQRIDLVSRRLSPQRHVVQTHTTPVVRHIPVPVHSLHEH